MSIDIPSFTGTIFLSAEEAAEVRLATKDVEIALEEDIWGKRGILLVEDQEQDRVHIKQVDAESSMLVRCPLASIQNAQDESGVVHMQRCFFRTSRSRPEVAEEVWLQEPMMSPGSAQCQHHGLVFTSNAHAKRPFCHVRLLPAAVQNVECSTFSMPIRAADMVLGRLCSLDYEEQTDQRNGRVKLVATKLCFSHLEGLVIERSLHGVVIQPANDIVYGAQSTPLSTIFAAFDQCLTIDPASTPIGSRVLYHLKGPLAAPEACDWQVEGVTLCPRWNLPRPPRLAIGPPCFEHTQNLRWFPQHPDDSDLVIASDPKCTKFRDDAFECNLDDSLGSGFLRVHVVNTASRIPRNSPQEKWMRRMLCRHHPADAENTRTLFASWASTSAGIGFTVQEHRPALTMQLNMKLVEDKWAVDGPALFFESMVRLSVLINSEKVTEEWVKKEDDASAPESLILHPLSVCSDLEKSVQQVFYDAQMVRENRWRRLDEAGRLEDAVKEEENEEEDNHVIEGAGDGNAYSFPKIWHEFNYNSNSRTFALIAEELQPSHFYAKGLLNIMNSEVFRVLDGYKEIFGLADSILLDDHEYRLILIDFLSESGLKRRQDYEDASIEELKEFVWKDLGGSLAELDEAMGWGARCKKMAMMADVADGARCHFEFTKPGRLYTQLVSQRIFLDFVKNSMKRPRQMSYSMGELRHLMEDTNHRQELNDRMAFVKKMALLKTAWPQLMQNGGLPTKGVVLREGTVYVDIIKAQVKCLSLAHVSPPAPIGTKVLIQLRFADDEYTAVLIAVYGRRREICDTLEGELCLFVSDDAERSGPAFSDLCSMDDREDTQCVQEAIISAPRKDSDDLKACMLASAVGAESQYSTHVLRADAPAFYPKDLILDEEQSADESSGGADFDLQYLRH